MKKLNGKNITSIIENAGEVSLFLDANYNKILAQMLYMDEDLAKYFKSFAKRIDPEFRDRPEQVIQTRRSEQYFGADGYVLMDFDGIDKGDLTFDMETRQNKNGFYANKELYFLISPVMDLTKVKEYDDISDVKRGGLSGEQGGMTFTVEYDDDVFDDNKESLYYNFEVVKVKRQYYLVMGSYVENNKGCSEEEFSYMPIDVLDFMLDDGIKAGV